MQTQLAFEPFVDRQLKKTLTNLNVNPVTMKDNELEYLMVYVSTYIFIFEMTHEKNKILATLLCKAKVNHIEGCVCCFFSL